MIVKPATILKFHRFLVKRKFRKLYLNKTKPRGRPPIDIELKKLVIEIKRKNPSFGCPKIAATVSDRLGVAISAETVRRILKQANLVGPGDGPSWLTFIGHQVDSLWSVDLFQVESILLQTRWVMIVMDQLVAK